jgi:hypothetical protein
VKPNIFNGVGDLPDLLPAVGARIARVGLQDVKRQIFDMEVSHVRFLMMARWLTTPVQSQTGMAKPLHQGRRQVQT